MQEIYIPSVEEILNMSSVRCQRERIRLKNEISFARGDRANGGPPNDKHIAALKSAIEVVEERLAFLNERIANERAAA